MGDFAQRQTAWSSLKKTWCCAHYLTACPDKYTEPFDCMAGFANWRNSWSQQKKQWCCGHHFHGCAAALLNATTTTTTEPFNCDAGLAGWENGWSHFKKEFCCRTRQRGCMEEKQLVDETTMGAIRCAHPDNVTLSIKEADWCCKHAKIDCPKQMTIAQKFQSLRAIAPDLKPFALPSIVGTFALATGLALSCGCGQPRGTSGQGRSRYLYTQVAVNDPDRL